MMRGLFASICLVLAGCVTDPPPSPVAAVAPPPTEAPTPPAATPRSPPTPKMAWDRIDGRRGREVAEQQEVDLATCKALAETLGAQLQQGQAFNLNLRACMGQHGYKLVAMQQH